MLGNLSLPGQPAASRDLRRYGPSPAPTHSAANALRLTIPRAVTLGTSTCIGLLIPSSIGPTGSPSDAAFSSVNAMFAASSMDCANKIDGLQMAVFAGFSGLAEWVLHLGTSMRSVSGDASRRLR
jgi:hypothetical protein